MRHCLQNAETAKAFYEMENELVFKISYKAQKAH